MESKSLGKKRFGELIKTLHEETKVKQPAFVNELFKTFGIKSSNDKDGKFEGLVKNWIAGRNQGYKSLFKGIKINQENDDKFVNFLNEMIAPSTRIKNVQHTLKKYRNEYPSINFVTNDSNEFYKSVLVQFKRIVGLLPDGATESIEKNNGSNNMGDVANGANPQHVTPSEKMLEIFNQAFDNCHINKLMGNTEILPSDLPFRVDCFIKTIKSNILNVPDYCKTEQMYEWISDLTDEVNEFNKDLKNNTRKSGADYIVPIIPLEELNTFNMRKQILRFEKKINVCNMGLNPSPSRRNL